MRPFFPSVCPCSRDRVLSFMGLAQLGGRYDVLKRVHVGSACANHAFSRDAVCGQWLDSRPTGIDR